MQLANLLKATTGLVSMSAMMAGVALAQGSADDEIIVTATRRAQSVQSIPSNISAVTADALDRTGVSDINALTRLVPGLTTFDEGPRSGGNVNNFNLRGLNANALGTNDDNPSATQDTVSVYLGETPIFFPFKLVDLERVEVLRGPQGTLYGAGSVGGTVRFIPKRPDPSSTYFEVNSEVSLTKESDKASYEAYLVANLPLSEHAAFRASGGYERLGGFIDAHGVVEQTGTARNPGDLVLADPGDILGSGLITTPTIKDHNDADLYFFRGSLLVEPTDKLEFQLNYTFQRNEVDGRYEDNPNYGSGEEYAVYKAFTEPQDSEIHLANLDVGLDLGFARLTSTTSYADVSTRGVSEGSGYLRTNIPQYYFGFPRLYAPSERSQDVDTFTQEVRLVSQTEGMFEWVLGGFYLKRDLLFNYNQRASGINDYTNAYFGLLTPVDFGDILATGTTDTTFKDLAGFGELTINLTDRLSVTGGFRVFHQTLKGTSGIPLPYASLTTEFYYFGTATDPYLLGGYEPLESDVTDSIFKANIAYDLSDDTLVYATWAQGFRAGGANALPAMDPFGNDNTPFLQFEPDTVNNYEVGIKGRLAGSITYTLTGFWVDWKDFQTSLFSPFGIPFVDNIPSARSRGFETELSGKLGELTNFGLGYTFVDAETTADFEFQSGDPTTLIGSGATLPGAAKHSLSGSLDHFIPISDGGSELIVHGDFSYRSHANSQFRDIPSVPTSNFEELDAFSVLNGSLTWRRDNLSAGLFVENLTNARGTTIVTTAQLAGASDQGYGVIRPRTFGLRLRVSTH
ncbi:MAG: TonB-dependent receptor [Amphiplicatus sp.]|nr:TonB-dependent receptor [Amphiplicatus sp.]